MLNLDTIQVKQTATASDVIEIDMTDFFESDAPIVFKFRKPSIADLFGANDAIALDSWRLQHPDLTRDLAQVIEFIARLHLEPKSSRPIGQIYYELLLQKMDAPTAARFLARIMGSVAPWAQDIETLIEAKKGL